MSERERKCPCCGKTVVGRSDKKFCSDGCRTDYHNRIYRERGGAVRKIDRRLKRNRYILDSLYRKGVREISVLELAEMGFCFQHVTSMKTVEREGGTLRLGCYDYACVMKGNGRLSIELDSGVHL